MLRAFFDKVTGLENLGLTRFDPIVDPLGVGNGMEG